ncbi:MAG: TlpA family protein disulfide reductase [Bacteroidales bacterium]|jgi:thiol-disulfide isomerase/thioredoxin|nr:TlpA family protein disulfide reductase [Bacteroidales bacterium]
MTVSTPFYVTYNTRFDVLMHYLPILYATTQYNGEQMVVSSANRRGATLAITTNLKKGDYIKVDYEKDEYIEIKDEFYKFLGVDVKKFVLLLEKIDKGNLDAFKTTDLSQVQVSSTKIGGTPFPFQAEEFITKKTIVLDSFREKYVLLDFFGTWCGPCIAEIPHLKELYSKTDRSKFEIIGIAVESSSDALERLIYTNSITWLNIMSDKTNRIAEIYGIKNYPTTILLDLEGIIIAKDLRGKELEEKVLRLLNE